MRQNATTGNVILFIHDAIDFGIVPMEKMKKAAQDQSVIHPLYYVWIRIIIL
jgi:hypothetical protein